MQVRSNNSVYAANIALLNSCLPAVAQKIIACENNAKKQYEMCVARNGQKTIKITGDPSYYLYSAYSPQKEVETYFKHYLFENKDVAVFFGMGLGYHFEEFKRLFGDRGHIIVIEPDIEFLTHICSFVDFLSFLKHNNVSCYFGEDIVSVEHSLATCFSENDTSKIAIIDPAALCKMNEHYFNRIRLFVKSQKIQHMHRHNVRNFEVKQMLSSYGKDDSRLDKTHVEEIIGHMKSNPHFSLSSLLPAEVNIILLYQVLFSADFGPLHE